MQTGLDCLPCFLKQAVAAARLATPIPSLQRQILHEVLRQLPSFDQTASPPENAVAMYRLIARMAGCADPYAGLKEEGNRRALELRSRVTARLDQEAEPLRAAIRFALAGNVIDHGAPHGLDPGEHLADCLQRPLAVDHSARFLADLQAAENILYLADNCGELVFDGLLIERLGKAVTLAVKEHPIINDALPTDARFCGLDQLCRVITNGTGCPGTPLPHCSPEFQEVFHRADLIISKGQGNYETLCEVRAPIYFLLTIKCRPVAAQVTRDTGLEDGAVQVGDMVLLQGRRG